MVVMYGCAPFDPPPSTSPWWPGSVTQPPPLPQRFESLGFTSTLHICEQCKRHVRVAEPCPFCMQSRLEALEKRIDALVAKVKADFSSAQTKKRKPKK